MARVPILTDSPVVDSRGMWWVVSVGKWRTTRWPVRHFTVCEERERGSGACIAVLSCMLYHRFGLVPWGGVNCAVCFVFVFRMPCVPNILFAI